MLIQLENRTAKVTNLNWKPEKHGDELQERIDIDLQVILKSEEVDQLCPSRGAKASKVFWDNEGRPAFTHAEPIKLDLRSKGTAHLGEHHVDELLDFSASSLKKVSIEPASGYTATLSCQVRVKPDTYLQELTQMALDQRCQFGFTATDEPEEDDDEKKKQQQQLEMS